MKSQRTFDDLRIELVGKTFDFFMDQGRRGFVEASSHIVLTFYGFFRTSSFGGKVDLSEEKLDELTKRCQRHLMDDFIMHGTKGIDGAIRDTYQMVINEARAEQDRVSSLKNWVPGHMNELDA